MAKNYQRIIELVEDPQQLEVTDDAGDTALHLAVAKQDALLVSLLLAYGAKPEALNNAGQIPTQVMSSDFLDSQRKHKKKLTYTEQAHKNRRLITQAFVTHFDRAKGSEAKHRAQARYLLAVREGDLEIARAAVKLGADPNDAFGHSGETVMHLTQRPKLVRALKSLGVDVNALDHKGRTPLTTAIGHGEFFLVKALLEAGARITSTPDHSDVALALSARKSASWEIANQLLTTGAPIDQSVWRSAIETKNSNAVGALIRRSSAFDENDKDWLARIALAQKIGGDRVIAAFDRVPEISAYLKRQTQANVAKSNNQLSVAGRFMARHISVLTAVILSFALLSALTALGFGHSKILYLTLACLGTAVMTHLFVFTDSIQLGLSEFRFFGEKKPGLSYLLYALFDGGALVVGGLVATTTWLVMRNHRRSWRVAAPAAVLSIAMLAVLFAHNSGNIEWPTSGYQQLTGYDDFLQRQEQDRQLQRDKSRVASNRAEAKRQAEKVLVKPHDSLFTAIKQNSIPAVEAALASGVPVDVRGDQGQTALLYALRSYRLEIVPTLLDAGANIHAVDDENRGAVHSLLRPNRYQDLTLTLLDRLVAEGADVNTVSDRGNTPLCLASGKRPGDRVSKMSTMLAVRTALIAHGAKFRISDRCAFSMYAKQPQILSLVHAQVAELNTRELFGKLNDRVATYQAAPLWQAAYLGQIDRVRLLLDLGADIESRDTMRGMTVLQIAVHHANFGSKNQLPLIQLLLERGANSNAIAWDGTTFAQLDRGQLLAQL